MTAPEEFPPDRFRRESRTRRIKVYSTAEKKFLRHWQGGSIIVLSVIAAAWLILICRQIHVQVLLTQVAQLNGVPAFALLTLLPLVGFPVSLLHVAAGLRFGFALGMVLVALSILLQLLASFALVNLWREAFARRLASVRKKIPRTAHGTACLFMLLLPGVPYSLKNYTLVLIGVPFRVYLAWCLPLHILRAVVTVGLGDQAGGHTPAGLVALAAYWLLILGASCWTYRRLRRLIAGQPAATSARDQPATDQGAAR